MLRGEEAGNASALSIVKIQMFWFTGLLVAAYLVMIAAKLPPDGASKEATARALANLPTLSAAFIGLLAIANGTYLADKAAPHTSTTPTTTPPVTPP